MPKPCTCEKCAAACRRIPGVFHPVEALRAIKAGMADDMMAVTCEHDRERGKARLDPFQVLMPRALKPSYVDEHHWSPHLRASAYDANGVCIFLNSNNLCEIHDSGFKPIECRYTLPCEPDRPDSERLGGAAAFGPWQTPVGRHVLKTWMQALGEGVGK